MLIIPAIEQTIGRTDKKSSSWLRTSNKTKFHLLHMLLHMQPPRVSRLNNKRVQMNEEEVVRIITFS